MKVCYLNHDLKSNTGAGRFCISLLNSLTRLIPNFGYEVLTHENLLPKKLWKLPLYWSRLRRVFKKYDVIHALDGWPYGFIAALAAWGLKKKLIITAIGTGAVKPLYSFWRRPLLKWAYKKADKIVAVSNNTKKEILKFLPNLTIEVINHGVDAAKYESLVGTSEAQNLKPYILSVGVLKKRKGYEYSIKAFAAIAPKFFDLKYVIIGKGPEKSDLVSQLADQNSGLKNRIIFLENLSEEELSAFYKNAELFILLPQDINKDIEGFGLAFLEAAAAGLPVIGAKNTSAEDAIQDGKNGILVESKNIKAAAGAMEKILSDQQLKEDFSKSSLNFAKSMNWKKAAERYVYNIYRQL